MNSKHTPVAEGCMYVLQTSCFISLTYQKSCLSSDIKQIADIK